MKNIMPPINTPDNAFHDGNPATGEQGTIVPGLWLNNIQGATRNTQQELISVLNEAEIEIDETKDNQLLTAILSLITANIPDLPAASLTQAGIVKLISSLTSDSESLAATAKAVKLVANTIVTSMSDHIQTVNPHHQYLAIANFLSEIKDVGPAAVAQTLLNLGLGDAAKMDDVKALVDAVFPIGIPLPYPLADIPAPAQGIVWFKMNGGSFNTTTYPKLAAKYPTGVLPDLRGEFIRGFDDGRGVRADQNLLGWQGHGIQSHNHGITNFEVRGVTGGPTSAWFTSGNGLATSNSGGDETRPRNIAFNYIVRAA
ncbi:hypothetical protein DVP94_14365 [Yersinia enterocolitica]|nr:hypothetical protein [Yersinia enterocolitica]